MLQTIQTFLAAHPMLRGALWTLLSIIAFGVFGAWFNWVTWKPTAAAWEQYQKDHPKRAKWLRVSRAILPHLRKIPALAPFFAAAEADQKVQSQQTEDSGKIAD